MKKPFKALREAATMVAEALGMGLDESYSMSDESYMFERYEWTIRELGVDNGKTFTLSISGDDLQDHFRELP